MATHATPRNVNGSPEPALLSVIDRATLQALQDVFSDRQKVAAAILDKNAEPIAFEHGHCEYCREIRKSTAAYEHCRACDKSIIHNVLESRRPVSARCDHGGLLDFAAPIRIGRAIVAFFFIGQMRDEGCNQTPERLRKRFRVLHDIRRHAKEKEVVSDRALKREFNRLPIRAVADIEKLQKAAIGFARDLSVALTKLMEWRKPEPVRDFIVKMSPVDDLEHLLDLCVREIPRLMGTWECTVLTVVGGSRATEPRLVLRRTSFGPSRKDEGKVSYGLGEGLTGWVWKNRLPLRLKNIRDPMELSRYHDLKWGHRTDDSKRHREWLGVPLFAHSGDVIGVIRVPQKKRARRYRQSPVGEGFDFEDEILLMSIGHHVAHYIEELQVKKRLETATRSCLQCAMDLTRAADEKQVGGILMRACERAFGSEGRSHFFNLLGDHGETLRIVSVGGNLSRGGCVGTEVPLGASLSGLAIGRERPEIVHDVAKAIERNQFFPANEKLACGMSAPIQFGQQVFGALSVGADRPFEFSAEPDLHTLNDLATLAGSALARLEAHWPAEVPFAHFARRTGHALNSRIATLEMTIAALKPANGRQNNHIAALESAIEFLKSAADLTLRYGRAWDEPKFQRVHIGEIVARLKGVCRDRRLHWIVGSTPELWADPWLVEQIIVELVVNALRFAPSERKSGRIVVRTYAGWTTPPLRKRRKAAVIEVRDNGPGVPTTAKQSIFQPYSTIDESRLGLGLSVVMRAVQAHGGLVVEKGREGQGACFRVLLPSVR